MQVSKLAEQLSSLQRAHQALQARMRLSMQDGMGMGGALHGAFGSLGLLGGTSASADPFMQMAAAGLHGGPGSHAGDQQQQQHMALAVVPHATAGNHVNPGGGVQHGGGVNFGSNGGGVSAQPGSTVREGSVDPWADNRYVCMN